MSAFWDNLKKNLKVWGSAAAERAEELGKAAATKTEQLTKVSKVRLEIHQLQRDMDKRFADLGKFVYEAADGENVTNFAGNEQFFSHINEAQNLIQQIRAKEKRIEEIKEEYRSGSETEQDTEPEAEIPSTEESES